VDFCVPFVPEVVVHLCGLGDDADQVGRDHCGPIGRVEPGVSLRSLNHER
jgi:hypothetical protein